MNSSSISGLSGVAGDDSGELVAKEMKEGFLFGRNVVYFGWFVPVVVENSGGWREDKGEMFMAAIPD